LVGSQRDQQEANRAESLAIDKRLAALDPTNIIWQRDLAVSQALVARLRGDTQ
jgi:hypothetical protein